MSRVVYPGLTGRNRQPTKLPAPPLGRACAYSNFDVVRTVVLSILVCGGTGGLAYLDSIPQKPPPTYILKVHMTLAHFTRQVTVSPFG